MVTLTVALLPDGTLLRFHAEIVPLRLANMKRSRTSRGDVKGRPGRICKSRSDLKPEPVGPGKPAITGGGMVTKFVPGEGAGGKRFAAATPVLPLVTEKRLTCLSLGSRSKWRSLPG